MKIGNSFADLQIKSNKQAQHTHTEAHVHNCAFISQKLKPSNHDVLTPFQGLFICLLFTAHWPSHPDLSLLCMAHLFQTDIFSMPAISPPDFSKWCLHNAAPTPSPPAQCLPPSHSLRLPSSPSRRRESCEHPQSLAFRAGHPQLSPCALPLSTYSGCTYLVCCSRNERTLQESGDWSLD